MHSCTSFTVRYAKQPAPLHYWLVFHSILQRLFRCPDVPFSTRTYNQNRGESLAVPELTGLLRDDLLGVWALDGDTLSFLWNVMKRDRPNIIIECGAGVSTLAMAKGLAEYKDSRQNFGSLISLEQNLWVKESIDKRLEDAGLREYTTILYAPLSNERDYQFNPNQLRKHLCTVKADLLIIDGPAGPDGCRASTLPSLAPFCRRGARWFLDDALRDGELRALNGWAGLTESRLKASIPSAKGLVPELSLTRSKSPVCKAVSTDMRLRSGFRGR